MKRMYFLISPNCNLRCKYCFQLANTPEIDGAKSYHNQRQLKADQGVVDALARFCVANGITHVELFGGEPLYYRDLFVQVVKRLCDQAPGMTFGVITNGTLITEEIMRLFEEYSISILLSLDGGRERHNQLRGGFDKISRWFERLVALDCVSVAIQAGVVSGLYRNVKSIWDVGFKKVFVNVIENYGWYTDDDVRQFEKEYEWAIQGMLRGEGQLNCATQLYEMLKGALHRQGCGITREGLACDWHGLLYPCHRAMEIGAQLAIGNVYEGIDAGLSREVRGMIDESAFHSPSSANYPLVSLCPVAIYQEHHSFQGEWNTPYSEMIGRKAKLVAKYFPALASKLDSVELPAGMRVSAADSSSRSPDEAKRADLPRREETETKGRQFALGNEPVNVRVTNPLVQIDL